MLADSSGLVALLDRSEPDHGRCVDVVTRHGGPLQTTWPAFTEAMHLLRRRAGWPGVSSLCEITSRGHVRIAQQPMTAQERMFELLRDYREVPMALADASLVTLAEERREARVLSLDDHFRVYVATWGRERHGFDVLP